MSNQNRKTRGSSKIKPVSDLHYWDMPTIKYNDLPHNVKNIMNQQDIPRSYVTINENGIEGGFKRCEPCDDGMNLKEREGISEWIECPECNRKKYYGII